MTLKGLILDKKYRRNGEISARKVLVVGNDQEKPVVMFLNEAIRFANEQELDLVEVGPGQNDIPVCKVMDYGAFVFKESKKMQENAKKNKEMELKEVRFRPVTDDGDFLTKLKQIKGFIEKGHKVRVAIKFKGREIAHAEAGQNMIERISSEIEPIAQKEAEVKMEGKQMIGVYAPLKKKKI